MLSMFDDWVLYFNVVNDEYLAPWGKDDPNPILVEYFKKHPIPKSASILDSGCAHGRNTKYFLDRNYKICGIDVSPLAINEAIEHTNRDDVFMIGDVLKMSEFLQYDYIIDDGCLHIMPEYYQYELVDKYKNLMKPGSRLFLIAFINHSIDPLFYITDAQKMPLKEPAGRISLPVYGVSDIMIDHLLNSFKVEYMNEIKSKINPNGIINLMLKKEN